MEEGELKNKRKDELYSRMKVIRLDHSTAFGDNFRYVRGKGLVKRDMKEN